MGVQDRDWYQEHWQRNVLGLRGRRSARAFRTPQPPSAAEDQPRRLPKGAEAGQFWTVLGLGIVFAIGVTVVAGAMR